MTSTYEKLLQNLNAVKCELKNRDDPALNPCIKYIKDAIVAAGRLNLEVTKLEIVLASQYKGADLDICDCED